MDQLKGSLHFSPLPAVAQFLAALGSTGRLKISQDAWAAEIALREGDIVGAQVGGDHGRAALEGMVLALTEADFAFVDGAVEADTEPLVRREDLAAYMTGLAAERERLQLEPNALASVPCLIDQEQNDAEAAQVTIQTTALQLIPSLVYGHTLEQIAQRRGLARTLREVAALRAGGLVRLAPAPVQAAAPTLRQAAAPMPPSAQSAPVRPLRSVPPAARPPQDRPAPAGVARRVNAFQASTIATPPNPDMPRPRLVREVAPVREVALEPLPRGRSWRSAVRGFFIAEEADAPRD